MIVDCPGWLAMVYSELILNIGDDWGFLKYMRTGIKPTQKHHEQQK